MALLFTNNASGTLANTLNIVDTSLVLNSGEGSLFPSPSGGDTFYATVEDTSGNLEVVSCTARSGDTLTITRAQEGTTAQQFAAGSRVEIRLTAATLNAFAQTVTADGDYAPLSHYNVDGTNAEILDNGNLSIKSAPQGAAIVKTTGQIETRLSLQDNTEIEQGALYIDSTGKLILLGAGVGDNLELKATNGSGTPVTVLGADPDGTTALRFADSTAMQTQDHGVRVLAEKSLAPYNGYVSILTDDNVTLLGAVGFIELTNEFRFQSYVDGFTVALVGQNGGTSVRIVDGSPGGAQNGYHAGAKKYSTAADGLAVTGVVTGSTAPTAASHLTRKDYVDTAVAAATSPDNTLSVNGHYTHPGAGGFTDQWGQVSVNGNDYETVTFSVPYATTFSVVATIDATDTGQTNNLTQVSSIGTSTFRIYNGGNPTATFYWQAKGVV